MLILNSESRSKSTLKKILAAGYRWEIPASVKLSGKTEVAFADAIHVPVIHLKNGKKYLLTRSDSIHFNHARLNRVMEICNEPPILQHLKDQGVIADRYTYKDAVNFIHWANRGWSEMRYFVFFVLDPAGRPAGCLDIKSNTRSQAEVGYWGSMAHAGMMTPSLGILMQLAREEGFSRLTAKTAQRNRRSIDVLRANGFTERKNSRQGGKSIVEYYSLL